MDIRPVIPATMQDRLHRSRVIPFVGAGVSMAVLDNRTGKPLFPSWKELLLQAAERLGSEAKPDDAAFIRSMLRVSKPDFLYAAKYACNALGSNWFDFIKQQFDPLREQANSESLTLAREVWRVGSSLVITTNYDQVLEWACPQYQDVESWDIESPFEQAAFLLQKLRKPIVWHLHGCAKNCTRIILTPNGYNLLYPDFPSAETEYLAALSVLRSLMVSHCFMFIGFSFQDEHFGAEFKRVYEAFYNTSGPHYLIVHEKELGILKSLNLLIEFITVPSFEAPLINLMHEIGDIVKGNSANSSANKDERNLVQHHPSLMPLEQQMPMGQQSNKQKGDSITRYNIVVIGKTGVGKSQLINYLFGKNIRVVKAGKPVTEKGFHREEIEINGIPSTLFDTWGLEVGRSSEWIEEISKELQNRGTDQPVENWFHTILYCVSVGTSRFEDFERDIILSFAKENYRAVVILTKADLAPNEDIEALISTIREDIGSEIPCIPVCSESKTLRTGITEKFGAEDVYCEIYRGFWVSISKRLPARCINVIFDEIDKWRLSQATYVAENIGLLGWKANDVSKHLEYEIEMFLKKISSQEDNFLAKLVVEEVKRVISAYGNFAKVLNLSITLGDTEQYFKDVVAHIPNFSVADRLYLIFSPIFVPGYYMSDFLISKLIEFFNFSSRTIGLLPSGNLGEFLSSPFSMYNKFSAAGLIYKSLGEFAEDLKKKIETDLRPEIEAQLNSMIKPSQQV